MNAVFQLIQIKKKGKNLASDTTNSILAFYEDDENSRVIPGMED